MREVHKKYKKVYICHPHLYFDRMKGIQLFIIVLTILLPSYLHAHQRDIILSDEDGLSGGSVRCIIQDSKGFMWFGTWNGLDRYDGHSFLNLKSEPGNNSTIHDNVVENILESYDGSIWVLTETGISRLRSNGYEIESFGFNSGKAVHNSMKSMDINGRGELFCAILGWGLSRFDEASGTMIPVNLSDMATSEIQYIACNTDSTFLVQTVNGKVLEYGHRIDAGGVFKTSIPVSILDGKTVQYTRRCGKQILICTADTAYLLEGRKIVGTCKLPDSQGITCVSRQDNNNITIVFGGSKCWTLNFSTGMSTITDVMHDGDILSLCHGDHGITWIGIDGLGVCESYEENLLFSGRFPKDEERTVLCLEEIGEGRVIAGTIGEGIYMAEGDSPFRKVQIVGDFSGKYAFSIYKSKSGEVFVGGYDEIGMVRGFVGDKIRIDKVCQIPGKIYSMYIDEENGNLWAGSFTSTMRIPFTRQSGRIVACEPVILVCQDDNGRDIDLSRSMSMISASPGELMIGATGNGIYVIDSGSQTLIQHICAANGQLSSDNILTMKESADGRLLVGTSYGLNIITRGTDGRTTTKIFNDSNGLVDNTVHSIIESKDGNIWIGTNKGIAMVNPNSGDFQAFVNAKLQSHEFCNSSCVESEDGVFWFGGTRGCDSFIPEEINARNDSPDIIFREFSSEKKSIRAFEAGRPIKLKHNDNFFSISYGAIDYVRGSDCEYRYRLKGLNSGWTEAGTTRNASFTNVPPGHYTFEVHSTNGDKEWCDNMVLQEIIIMKPWWKTNFAMISYIFMLMLLGFAAWKIASHRIEQKHKLDLAHLEKEKQAENYEGKLNFFTNLAHEFGTPLTLISTSSEQLMEKGSGSPNDRYLNVIKKSADRMQRLISELVEFRKIDSGSLKLKYSQVDVNAMAEGILDDFYDVNQKKHTNLQKDIPQEAISMVTDSNALERILYNLLSNAYKYVTPYGDILMKVDKYGNGVRFIVRNSSSKGIKPEDLEKIFDRYSILDTFEKQAGNEKVNRNGLGLAIVKDLVDMLGGTVSVSNEEDKSVQFTLFIPDDSDQPIEDIPISSARSSFNPIIDEDINLDVEKKEKSGVRIMVVEDDDDMRAMIADILQDEFDIIQACNGKEALNLVDIEHPDLIVTDLMMPEMDGTELLRSLRSSNITKLIPVVFLTFKTDIESELKVLEMGGDAFIHKPFHRKQLITVVRNILYKRTSLKTYYSSMQSNLEVLNGVQMAHEDKDFICRLTDCVEKNISDDALSLDFLAEKMAISKMTLYRKIKDITGQTPSEFINKVKINRAVHLLKTTKMTIQEIMFAAGYNNKSYFYRKFAEANGMTPKEFRDNQS